MESVVCYQKDYYDDIRQQQLRELGILNVDKKANTKLRYSPDITGLKP